MGKFHNVKSLWFVPLNNQKIAKSKYVTKMVALRKPDAIILDLEDAVPEHFKEEARSMIVEAVEFYSQLGVKIAVRVNKQCYLDLQEVAKVIDKVDAVIIPKVETLEEVEVAEAYIGKKVGVFIETISGILNIDSYIGQSSIVMAMYGVEDLTLDMGLMQPTRNNLLMPAATIQMHCARYDIPFYGILGEFSNISQDVEQFVSDLRFAKEMGFSGAFAVYETQIENINTIFAVTGEELELYAEILEIASTHKNGIFEHKGKMFGPPMIAKIKKFMEKNNATA